MKKSIVILLLFISVCVGQTLDDAFAKIAPKNKLQAASYAFVYQWDMNHHQAFVVMKIAT